jgi:hypothetical protein
MSCGQSTFAAVNTINFFNRKNNTKQKNYEDNIYYSGNFYLGFY